MKKGVVLDASVILVFLIGSNKRIKHDFVKILNQAREEKLVLYSHKLLSLEVANGLRYSLTDQNLANEALDKFLALPIKYISLTQTQHKKSFELAWETKTSVYDASYHVLALALGVEFVTCDEKYYKRVSSLGHIKLLS